MTKRLDISFICGAGLGSSLACQMEAEEVLHQAGVRADIIVSAENFKPTIEKYELDPSITVVDRAATALATSTAGATTSPVNP